MLPVVPKVRVGDVLYATRNLRNWLQTASLKSAANYAHEGGVGGRVAKSIIYTPKRTDKYVVCVNTGRVFAVFIHEENPKDEMGGKILFFINPLAAPKYRPISAGRPVGAPSRGYRVSIPGPSSNKKKKKTSAPKEEGRMSPALFSTWFVRSTEKMPDLRLWPTPFYAVWASLQMNAGSIRGDYKLALSMPQNHDYLFFPHMRVGALGPFGGGKRMRDRGAIRASLQFAIKVGKTRQDAQDQNVGSGAGVSTTRGFGPRLSDIPLFRKVIRNHLQNPRTRKSVLTAANEAENVFGKGAGRTLEEMLDSFDRERDNGLDIAAVEIV